MHTYIHTYVDTRAGMRGENYIYGPDPLSGIEGGMTEGLLQNDLHKLLLQNVLFEVLYYYYYYVLLLYVLFIQAFVA
jgi:hypothetical protein